jgi:predicted ribonuclease YlaK
MDYKNILDLIQLEVTSSDIDALYLKKYLPLQTMHNEELYNNQYVVLSAGQQSALCKVDLTTKKVKVINSKEIEYRGIKPRDARQVCMMEGLKSNPLFVALGGAGTGKTTLALAYAIQQKFRHDKRIVLCKPTTFVGNKSNAIAAIPGDHREKMSGYIDSYLCAMSRILGEYSEHHLAEWEQEGSLEFKPLELMRGMHFEDCIVILDEAQNTSPHELLTLLSRIADTSSLIILGDDLQIDLDIPFPETGLGLLVRSLSFFDSDVCAGIALKAQYRGVLADLAIDVLTEIRDNNETNAR